MPINRVSGFCDPNSVKGKRRKIIRLPLYFLIALLCILGSPVLAKVPSVFNASSPGAIANITTSNTVLEQGKALYDAGRFAEAVQILQQAVEEYRLSQENLKLAIALSNLSLAYQQLGAWNQAQQASTDSLNLLKSPEKKPKSANICPITRYSR